ncbi:MAG TPA: FKBP-type peptidyl-prolyl cis-trans isomerase [Cyclobacteriaceae bacterium]
MRSRIVIVLFLGLLIGCNKDTTPVVPPAVQLEKDIVIIDQYLADKGITATKDTTGVRYVVHKLGTGPKPTLSNCIRVSYTGTFLSDGSQFDTNSDIKFVLGSPNLITGWKIAFPKLPQGSKATLYIPSVYAYGPTAKDKIPANSNLIFEVELLDVYAYNSAGAYCYPDPLLLPEVQLAKDVAIIDQYLTDKGISAQTDPSGLRYTIQSLGTGAAPTLSNCIMIKYSGKLLSGSLFDQNGTGFKSPLKNLITGLKTGLPLLPKGTKATFYIPSGLAYGPVSSGSKIPANANLIFELELVDVTDYNATTDSCN